MGVGEQNTLFSKPIDIRRVDRVGTAAEAADPVVQIVDRDEQDVRPVDHDGSEGPLAR